MDAERVVSWRIAIIGGGPGGLLASYFLQQRCSQPLEVTIYEAGERVGGKVLTAHFTTVPVSYEAGAAEVYDYSHVGEDPLRELIRKLRLPVEPLHGGAVVLQGQLLDDLEDVERVYGAASKEALAAFDERAKAWMDPRAYYGSDEEYSAADPLAGNSFEDELAKVPDRAAQEYLRVMVHSDVATEPHQTSASYGLQNYLMNDPRYLRLYTIVGGLGQLPEALAAEVHATIHLNRPVERVVKTDNGRMRVRSHAPDRGACEEEYDFVVVALPLNYLPTIRWEGDALHRAMQQHYVHYDHPAHYLRVSVLFREQFWAGTLDGSYLMLDAFGGCCLYDESSRNGSKTYGVLGWLVAGEAAVRLSNLAGDAVVQAVLDSLPEALRHGREFFLEGQVHRWLGSVNGRPGGAFARDLDARHSPDPTCPNLFVVGDYLYDSTLNGVLDSAEYVAESLVEEMAAAVPPAAPELVGSEPHR